MRDVEETDIDIATDARPEVVEQLVRPWADAVWLQGQRFGTVGCRKDGTALEITTFRAEVYRPESRKPEVAFSDDIETDLSRRDFTVNAMALRAPGARCSSTRSAARPTSPPVGCARRSRPRCRSSTTRCACCAPARFVAQLRARARPGAGRGGRSSCDTGSRS